MVTDVLFYIGYRGCTGYSRMTRRWGHARRLASRLRIMSAGFRLLGRAVEGR